MTQADPRKPILPVRTTYTTCSDYADAIKKFAAMVVIMLALVSFWPSLRFAHVANLVMALWLIAFGFSASSYPTPPVLQNDIAVGLLLLMFAIVPNKTTRPPRSWRDFFARGRNNGSLLQS